MTNVFLHGGITYLRMTPVLNRTSTTLLIIKELPRPPCVLHSKRRAPHSPDNASRCSALQALRRGREGGLVVECTDRQGKVGRVAAHRELEDFRPRAEAQRVRGKAANENS